MEKENTKVCDHCEEECQSGFFCKDCSGFDEYDDDTSSDYPELYWNDVCLNCCSCHLSKRKIETKQLPNFTEEEIPF